MGVRLKLDPRQVTKLLATVPELRKAATRALANAGDKEGRAFKKKLVAKVRQVRNLKSAFVRDAITLKRPARSTGLENMVWRIRIVGKPVPLATYPHTDGRDGLVVKVKPGSSAKLPHSFVAPALDSRLFRRVGKERGPLVQLYSSPISRILEKSNGILERLQREAVEGLRTSFLAGLEKQREKLR